MQRQGERKVEAERPVRRQLQVEPEPVGPGDPADDRALRAGGAATARVERTTEQPGAGATAQRSRQLNASTGIGPRCDQNRVKARRAVLEPDAEGSRAEHSEAQYD